MCTGHVLLPLSVTRYLHSYSTCIGWCSCLLLQYRTCSTVAPHVPDALRKQQEEYCTSVQDPRSALEATSHVCAYCRTLHHPICLNLIPTQSPLPNRACVHACMLACFSRRTIREMEQGVGVNHVYSTSLSRRLTHIDARSITPHPSSYCRRSLLA